MKNAIELIADERQRQIKSEGWTEEHDDQHNPGVLLQAALCYVAHGGEDVKPPHDWPWDSKWWKPCPGDRVRALVKAGALVQAEQDRLERVKQRIASDIYFLREI